jgi:hypothetical protein
MKNRIIAALGEDKVKHIENITYPQIHVTDLTQRTNSAQGILISDTQPEGIETLLIENPNLDITATLFKPQCFRDEHGYEPDNCEGVFYLTNSTDQTWVLFLEIKDCKHTNISKYFTKSKKQIIETVQIFRDKKIIAVKKRVYANISFPRRDKISFYKQVIEPGERKGFLDKHNIFICGTNKLVIKNDKTIVAQ